MARLRTEGAEIFGGVDAGSSYRDVGFSPSGGTLPTRDTATFRSGVASYKCDSGAGNTASYIGASSTGLNLASTTYYWRAYVLTSAAPSSAISFMGSVTTAVGISMLTSGALQLVVSNVNQGSPSSPVNDGAWHRVELSFTVDATAVGQVAAELRVDGATIATWSGTTGFGPIYSLGWQNAPGANKVMYLDDIAINDSTGANQNSWPGDGKIVLLKPISDNARGANWTGGAGGTTNLWDALDNTPPVGAATPGTNTSQIRNIAKDTTGNYDANLQSYTAAGVPSGATITLTQGFWNLGGAATGDAMQVVSNPAVGVASTGSPGTTLGAWPTGWTWFAPSGQIAYSPPVTLGTSPVLRVGKRQNSTNEAACDFMGLIAEYVPAAVPEKPRRWPSRAVQAAVMRAATR